jgi:hypothetical protein
MTRAESTPPKGSNRARRVESFWEYERFPT